VYTEEPLKLPGRRGAVGDEYSIGLSLGPDGTVSESTEGGPAFQAGIGPGMKIAGVNGRVYSHDLLDDAMKAAKDKGEPITLLVITDEYFRTFTIDYRGGAKYPHLVREPGDADLLDELIKARAGQ
jgi:predicted metalloprotease with PDZ domain